jgi:hypothetical protein
MVDRERADDVKRLTLLQRRDDKLLRQLIGE